MSKKKDAQAHMMAVHKQMTRLLKLTYEADTYLRRGGDDDASLDRRQLKTFGGTLNDFIARLPHKIRALSEPSRPDEERTACSSPEEPAVKG